MLKSELQHHFWVTKKVVQRKLGIKKEDECVVSSDALLDTRIVLFKSISDSSKVLYHILDQYQERLCYLALEEYALGKFLKEASKTSHTTSKILINAGTALCYKAQVRMTIRSPLLRFHDEVEVFRDRAVKDTLITISVMEKQRTEYRAALSWIKSISEQLDPDSGRGIETFRRAQNKVRNSKSKFDRLSLDCLQKIDLLAASRSSMFSNTLVLYMTTLLNFYTKTTDTIQAVITLLTKPQYNFNILKDLSQTENIEELEIHKLNECVKPMDSDEMLFFLNEYSDNSIKLEGNANNVFPESSNVNQPKLNEITNLQNESDDLAINENDVANIDLASKNLGTDVSKLKSTNFDLLLESIQMDIFSGNSSLTENLDQIASTSSIQSINPILPQKTYNNSAETNVSKNMNKSKDKKPDISSWYKLFSELDPFEDMEKKISGTNDNSQCA